MENLFANFSFPSRNWRNEFQSSLSLLQIRENYFKFLFLFSIGLFALSSMTGVTLYMCIVQCILLWVLKLSINDPSPYLEQREAERFVLEKDAREFFFLTLLPRRPDFSHALWTQLSIMTTAAATLSSDSRGVAEAQISTTTVTTLFSSLPTVATWAKIPLNNGSHLNYFVFNVFNLSWVVTRCRMWRVGIAQKIGKWVAVTLDEKCTSKAYPFKRAIHNS